MQRFLSKGLVALRHFLGGALRITSPGTCDRNIGIGGGVFRIAARLVVLVLRVGLIRIAQLVMRALQIRRGKPLCTGSVGLLDHRARTRHLFTGLRPLRDTACSKTA